MSVNDHRAYRKGSYFWDQLPLDNSSNPVWASVTNLTGVLNNGASPDTIASNIGNVFLPQNPGNLLPTTPTAT